MLRKDLSDVQMVCLRLTSVFMHLGRREVLECSQISARRVRDVEIPYRWLSLGGKALDELENIGE